MPAYIIVMREEAVRDAGALQVYQAINRDRPRDPNLKPLAVYGKLEALEGEAPDGVVILEFPTLAAARAWYDSDDYQRALPHRLKAARHRTFIVEGL